MRKSLSIAALALTATLALSACGGQTDSQPAGASPSAEGVTPPSAEPVTKETTPAPEPTPTTDEKRSDRGNLIMAPGDTGIIKDQYTDAVHAKFTVHSIKPAVCNGPYPQAAENGHLFAVDVTVETTKELGKSTYPKYDISGHDFKYIAANGTTFNGSLATIGAYSCLADAENFPSDGLGPAEKVRAKVVVDLPATKGILVLQEGLSGFEYKF
jgi:hypothetical protein